MQEDCIFCKIISGAIPSTKIYEDEHFLVFKDIKPAAPIHWLVVPKAHIPRLSEAKACDRATLGELLLVAGKVARDNNLGHFRLIINDGADSGQTVFHLHAHILSGQKFPEKLF